MERSCPRVVTQDFPAEAFGTCRPCSRVATWTLPPIARRRHAALRHRNDALPSLRDALHAHRPRRLRRVLLAATRANGVVKLSVLKCLWPELAGDPDFVEMFLDEARLCARLAHPNVVQTHDVVQHEGRLALAMEYLEGQPLRRRARAPGRRDRLPFATRLRIVSGRARGASVRAHARGLPSSAPLEVVHRDA